MIHMITGKVPKREACHYISAHSRTELTLRVDSMLELVILHNSNVAWESQTTDSDDSDCQHRGHVNIYS